MQGLQLQFLTRPETPANITAIMAWKDLAFAAWGDANSDQGFWVFKRGKKIYEITMPTDLDEPVQQIIIFGSWIVGCCLTRIEVWKSNTYEHYTTLYSSTAAKDGNEITGGICNMPTYLNKIFAGKKDGSVEIWNVCSGKLIYTILPPAANCGSVLAVQSTPVLSLLAISYSHGPLIIHNIKTDHTVIYLECGDITITSISFRMDDLGAGKDGRKPGVMATSNFHNGDVILWDLNDGGRVMGILRGAHNPPSDTRAEIGGGISKIQFLPGQPIFITCGLDNSLRSWIFDESPFSPIPRILHSRSGHGAPITKLHFLPSDFEGVDCGGKWLLSAGQDQTLWGWSLRRDGQSTELSQGNIRKKARNKGIIGLNSVQNSSILLSDLKASEITCISVSLNRDGGIGAIPGERSIWQKIRNQKKQNEASASANTGWESIVTGHKNDKFARTWFWGRKKAGRWIFETGDGGNVMSVAVSPCGTFAVIGSDTGSIDTFNLQSGLHRQRYPAKLSPAQARNLKLEQINAANLALSHNPKSQFPMGYGKHKKAVTGLAVDPLNKTLVSCSLDGKLKFWDFRTGHIIDELSWEPVTAITGIRYNPANDLIALACEDPSIRVVDFETRKTIRQLRGCWGSVNDFCFSSDGRWIIAACSDCLIRVWDLPTGHLIDGIRTKVPCVTLSFSLTGEFLATAFENELGINIWNNRALFSHIPTHPITEKDILEITAPSVSGQGSHHLLDSAYEDQMPNLENSVLEVSPEQLSPNLQTLSSIPKSRWQNLLHLDLIKSRNKPREAPKAPEKAPFFLQSLDKAYLQGNDEDNFKSSKKDNSRIIKPGGHIEEGKFTSSLRDGYKSCNCKFLQYLNFLSNLKRFRIHRSSQNLIPISC